MFRMKLVTNGAQLFAFLCLTSSRSAELVRVYGFPDDCSRSHNFVRDPSFHSKHWTAFLTASLPLVDLVACVCSHRTA